MGSWHIEADHQAIRGALVPKTTELERCVPTMASGDPESSRHLWIGTSGWTYTGWRGSFYPNKLAAKCWLRWYAGKFPTTEINGSFYRTPSFEAVRAWRDQTPDEFIFSWKASKFITHWKRLSESCRNSLELTETRLKVLEPKVGPVLFQLPPRFKADRERLASFLKMLSKKRRYAFEFRDASWYEPQILALLHDRNIALCLSDHHETAIPVAGDRGACLSPRSRPDRPIQGSLPAGHPRPLGGGHRILAAKAAQRLLLFR